MADFHPLKLDPVRWFSPKVERPVTNLVEKSFDNHFPMSFYHSSETTLWPADLGYEGNRDEVYEHEFNKNVPKNQSTHVYQSLPKQWQDPKFKAEITNVVKAGIKQALHNDVLVLTGGRDYDPLLLGNPRHETTNRYSCFDIRDIVETYALLAAIANGKVIHSTCRGFQVVTGNMMQIFADEPVPMCQDIPELLEQYAKNGRSEHHGGTGLVNGINERIRENPAWFHSILTAQQQGKRPELEELQNATNEIKVTEEGLLCDAFRLADTEDNHNVQVREDTCYASPATAHHQGWAIPESDPAQYEAFVKALRQAGGKIAAVSSDPRDEGVHLIEAVKFSKVIDEAALQKIQKRVEEMNQILGLNIQIPMPDLSKGKVIRVDIPQSAQPHLEFGMAGEALMVPALTLAFTRAKKRAEAQGMDIKGYDYWSKTVDLEQLPEVASVLPKNMQQQKKWGDRTSGSNERGIKPTQSF